MSAGKLDQRITIQELTRVNNEGSLSESYTDVATVWGDVTGAKGSEALQSAQVRAQRVVRVKIRYPIIKNLVLMVDRGINPFADNAFIMYPYLHYLAF